MDHVPNDRQFLAPAVTYRIDDRTTVTLLTSYQHDHTAGQQFLPSQGTAFANPNGRIPTSLFTGDKYNKVDRTVINLGYEIEHKFGSSLPGRCRSPSHRQAGRMPAAGGVGGWGSRSACAPRPRRAARTSSQRVLPSLPAARHVAV